MMCVAETISCQARDCFFLLLVHTAGPNPNNGKADTTDNDPIHPLKHVAPGFLDSDEAKVYEIVVRSFLACLSRNAKGHDTTVTIDIAGENFTAKGTQILDRGFLEVILFC